MPKLLLAMTRRLNVKWRILAEMLMQESRTNISSVSDDAEETVRRLLEELRFKCCPEPDWIDRGKKPDFFCAGQATIWVEVKSLGLTPADNKASQLHHWFESRFLNNGPGAQVSAAYSGNVTEQDVAEAVSRVRRILARTDLSNYSNLIVTVPKRPDFTTDIEFSIHSSGQRLLILSAKDESGFYGAPYLCEHIKGSDKVEILENGDRRESDAGKLGLDGENVKLGVLIKPWPHPEISLSGSIKIGKAEVGWPDRDRFLSDAKDAAAKIKNALKYECAPSIVFFVSEDDTPASCKIRIHSLKTMLYGVPTLISSMKPDDDSVIHGQNAFWNNGNNGNTSVSAACYVTNGTPICLFHNPFANLQFPEGLFKCEEFRGLENGKLQKAR